MSLALLTGLAACSSDDDPSPVETGEQDGGATGEGGDSGDASEGVTYCDVEEIIDQKCVLCHSEEPVHGAPMSLATYEDAVDSKLIFKIAVEEGWMPELSAELDPEVEDLTDAERELLLEWLEADAPDCP